MGFMVSDLYPTGQDRFRVGVNCRVPEYESFTGLLIGSSQCFGAGGIGGTFWELVK
jgi:hypothetical protein